MERPIQVFINDELVETSLSSGTVVLDFLRKERKLTGTKEGCKEGECGACTVLLGELKNNNMQYKAVASCLLPLGEVAGKHIVTVEGLNQTELNPVQQSIVEENATQCGFCTPGIILSLTGFFLTSSSLEYDDGIDALDGNICRCTGYVSIRNAIRKLSVKYSKLLNKKKARVEQLVKWSILPAYFLDIAKKISMSDILTVDIKLKEDEVLVAGGTDLFVQRPLELSTKKLNFISNYTQLTGIKERGKQFEVGAGTTVEELKNSETIKKIFPGIKEILNLISSTIMRNRATLGGNIINASPIGDMSVFFLALDASLILAAGSVKREVLLRNFFKGYKDFDLKTGEIIELIRFNTPQKNAYFNFEKVSQRKYLDIASCNSAIYLELTDDVITNLHVSAGGVAPYPLYLTATVKYLLNKKLTVDNIKKAAQEAQKEIAPISDIRGSNKYKRFLLTQLIYAHFIKLFPEKIKFEELL